MMKPILVAAVLLFFSLCWCASSHAASVEAVVVEEPAAQATAPVKVFCADYVTLKPQVDATVTVQEMGQPDRKFGVGKDGLLFFNATVGSHITILAESPGHHLTQSALLTIPPEGLISDLDFVAMQIPSNAIYDLFFTVTPGKKDLTKCFFVVTACAPNKTIYDHPQGLPGSHVELVPARYKTRFYFGTWGPFSNATNPLPNHLNGTSWDGGVLFEDVDVDASQVYTITASHPGYTYSATQMQCLEAGRFVNGAPNQGPRATPNTAPQPPPPRGLSRSQLAMRARRSIAVAEENEQQ